MKITDKEWTHTSVSQAKTFLLCQRKWWLDKRMRLPREDKDHFHFGTALHSIAERFLEADDAGRDRKTGEVVDLFPEGWDEVRDRDGDLVFFYTEEQRELIKEWVKQAVANGTWERAPGRKVERKIERKVAKTGITLIGYIDLELPGEIQDHKTSKNSRYASTKKKLVKDVQLLIYAKVLLDESREGPGAALDQIVVRHNVFLKDGSKEPYTVQVILPEEDIDAAWDEFVATTKRMIEVSKIESLADVEWPEDGDSACMAYGGCEFKRICGQRETLDHYAKRVNHLNTSRKERVARKHQSDKENDMGGLFGGLKKKGGTAEAPPPAEDPGINAPETAEEEVEEQATAETTERIMAPWADPHCPACEDNDVGGYNSKGKVCRICQGSLDERKVPANQRPSAFDVSEPFKWKPKKVTKKVTKKAAKKVAKKEEPPAEPEPQEEEETEEEEQNTAPLTNDPMPTASAPKGKRGRQKKGFTILIGCAPIDMPGMDRNVVMGDELFRIYRERMTEGSEDGANYWDLDPFKRRERMSIVAEQIVDELGTRWVVFPSGKGNPDLTSWIDALRGYAQTVVIGTAV